MDNVTGVRSKKEPMENVELRNVVVPWAKDKEEFLCLVRAGEWVITEKDELYFMLPEDDEYSLDSRIKETFFIYGLALHHTTDWVRFYFEEHYPEIDFDKEFETDKPGVFSRIQETYGYEYEDWVNEDICGILESKLAKLGWRLPWPDGSPNTGQHPE